MWAGGPVIVGKGLDRSLLKAVEPNLSRRYAFSLCTFSSVGGQGSFAGLGGRIEWLEGCKGCWVLGKGGSGAVCTALIVGAVLLEKDIIGLGKVAGRILRSTHPSRLRKMLLTLLHMNSACLVVSSPIVNWTGSHP